MPIFHSSKIVRPRRLGKSERVPQHSVLSDPWPGLASLGIFFLSPFQKMSYVSSKVQGQRLLFFEEFLCASNRFVTLHFVIFWHTLSFLWPISIHTRLVHISALFTMVWVLWGQRPGILTCLYPGPNPVVNISYVIFCWMKTLFLLSSLFSPLE